MFGLGYMSGGGAQYGKTAGYAAARQSERNIIANRTNYSPKGVLSKIEKAGNRIAISKGNLMFYSALNIFQSTPGNFFTTALQNIFFG